MAEGVGEVPSVSGLYGTNDDTSVLRVTWTYLGRLRGDSEHLPVSCSRGEGSNGGVEGQFAVRQQAATGRHRRASSRDQRQSGRTSGFQLTQFLSLTSTAFCLFPGARPRSVGRACHPVCPWGHPWDLHKSKTDDTFFWEGRVTPRLHTLSPLDQLHTNWLSECTEIYRSERGRHI